MLNIIVLTLSIIPLCLSDQRCVFGDSQDPELRVKTLAGEVLGVRQAELDPRTNKTVRWRSYFDVPYAQPPVGSLRFRPPEPPSHWSCLRDATRSEDQICPQIDFHQFSLSGVANGGLHDFSNEDCLYLNVYVPETEEKKLAVMVKLISLTRTGTSTWYGPLLYLAHEVIVVSVRYRLGPLGFLSLGTEEVPGNAGVRDQLAALRWVRDNILSFGGDSDLVTVYGQSAGSFSSTYHLLSPLARQDGSSLFRRAILESGAGGFSPSFHHFTSARATKYGRLAAAELGCLTLSLADTVNCLRGKSVASVMTVDFINQLMSQPSIDQEYLPREPLDIMREGDYSTEVDIMIGFNEDEALIGTQIMLPAPDLFGVVRELWGVLGPYALLQKHTSEITGEDVRLSEEILNHYCGPLETLDHSKWDNFTRMATDSFFWFGVHRFLDLHLQQSSGKTFFYRNKYIGEHHSIWAPGLDYHHYPWVGHSDEQFLQWRPYGDNLPLNTRDLEMSLKMTTMWTNFVKFGDPTPDGEMEVEWDASRAGDVRYLTIDNNMTMGLDDDYVTRMAFWDSIL